MSSYSISIVIPSYNGEGLFKQYLSRNLDYFHSVGITDVIIVDDASDDDSVSYLQTHFPTVRLVQNKINKGFGITANRGVSIAQGTYVFLLNSDMLVTQMNWDKIVATLSDPHVFAVVPPIIRKRDGKPFNESYTYGSFKGGWVSTENDIDVSTLDLDPEGLPLLWACGGAMCFRKETFMQLGGFDTVFSPFYVEDLDLSYRAWKRGMKVVYCSDGHIDHQHQSTIGTYYTKAFVTKLHLRNKYLFTWRNLTYFPYMLSHFVTVVLKMLTFQVKDMIAILNALWALPSVLRYRWTKGPDLMSDRAILGQWRHLR